MPWVWMYQHPSNRDTWKEYSQVATTQLEKAYQEFLAGRRSVNVLEQLEVGEDIKVVVAFKAPVMLQNSPFNKITRRVRRFWEDESS